MNVKTQTGSLRNKKQRPGDPRLSILRAWCGRCGQDTVTAIKYRLFNQPAGSWVFFYYFFCPPAVDRMEIFHQPEHVNASHIADSLSESVWWVWLPNVAKNCLLFQEKEIRLTHKITNHTIFKVEPHKQSLWNHSGQLAMPPILNTNHFEQNSHF